MEILKSYLPDNFPVYSTGYHERFVGMLLNKFLININSKDVAKIMEDSDHTNTVNRTIDYAKTMYNVLHHKVKEIRDKTRTTTRSMLSIAQAFEKIRSSGVTNMLRRDEVQVYADKIGAHELVVAIEDAGRHGYMNLMSKSLIY